MAPTPDLPVRENCFMFNAPEGDVSIDDLIDAVELTAGEDSVFVLQHMGGAKFLVCTRNSSQATKLMVSEGFQVNGVKVPVEAVGAPVTFVNAYRYPAYLSDETLCNALSQFGKVKGITFTTVATRQTKLNGVRVIKIEMRRPVPNFMTIAGHRVMFEYRGMRRVCARCSEVGHMASACSASYCKRCGAFGHETEGCAEECKRCGGHHGTKECFRQRSYASIARGFPRLSGPAPSASHLSGPPSSGAFGSPRLQVLTPRTAGRMSEKGLHSGGSETSAGQPTGSSTEASCVTEEEGLGRADDASTRSAGTEQSDSESLSVQSSPTSPPTSLQDQEDSQSSPTAFKGGAKINKPGEAPPSVSKAPANLLAPVTTRDLEHGSQDAAPDDAPIMSRGSYSLPSEHGDDATAPASTAAPPALRPGRKPDTTASQPAPGREQRTRARSRRQQDADDMQVERERAASRERGRRRPV
ncbi:uncharacterized protein LOC119168652 isoform X1 [Rhipicephalus microplus]|uniref:uncharacterized protein LOC119168652 isoform X1 n=1 Tax=Rhipicephalus microplus TaxID=6941 RepID=UPI003F6A685E